VYLQHNSPNLDLDAGSDRENTEQNLPDLDIETKQSPEEPYKVIVSPLNSTDL
jgi:hypothetical protein